MRARVYASVCVILISREIFNFNNYVVVHENNSEEFQFLMHGLCISAFEDYVVKLN